MELAEPSIGTAFEACVAAGATTIVVAPYLLWPGNHWERDIPALATEASTSAVQPAIQDASRSRYSGAELGHPWRRRIGHYVPLRRERWRTNQVTG